MVFNIQVLRASGTIYIRADGSIEGTDKIERDGNLYVLTENICDEIVVERDNIVVDGKGYTIQGTGSRVGIDLTHRSNVTIRNMRITTFYYAIYFADSSGNNISRNEIYDMRGDGARALADLNKDSLVNILDISLVAKDCGKTV
jgi:hypothetical protein